MLQPVIQPIRAEDLPAEEYRFVIAQQSIYNLFNAVDRDKTLKLQLEAADNPEAFLKIAAEKGYEFAVADLQLALQWALENTELHTDEFDDYELSDEDLEAVAGGTVRRRNATNNSYWHSTGILVDDQCFYLTFQSLEIRSQILVGALQNMERWEWQGNGTVKVSDDDGRYASYTISNLAYDGSTTGRTIDTSDSSVWQTFS